MAKVKLRLRAEVVEEHGLIRIKFNSPTYYRDQLEKLRGHKTAIVTIENLGTQRSLNQNAYVHGVCYPVLAELTGYSEIEIKELTKVMFIKPKIVTIREKEYELRRGTHELEKWEFGEYIDALMALAIELGGTIPTPESAGYHIVR
jgi:hypothetical protein